MRRLIRQHLRRKALITLKSGHSFGGVLYEADPECVILRNAEAIGVTDTPVPVDGEVLILRSDIDFVQFP